MKRKVIVFSLLLLFVFSPLFPYNFLGKIHDTKNKPLKDGYVLLKKQGEDNYIKASLNSKGEFVFRDLKPGIYDFKLDIYSVEKLKQKIEIKGDIDKSFVVNLSFLDRVLIIIRDISDILWGSWMIILLVGTGIILSIFTRFVQIRRIIASLKLVLKGALKKDKTEEEEGDISPYAALMTALAATVGNGNIAGVATAIATGGPGAPFWMWVAGFFGMATKYSEGFLGVKFRRKNALGEMAGGPMYYARYGIKWKPIAKFLGFLFAGAGAITALFGTGNMAQSNSMALAFKTQFGIPFWASGLLIAALTGIVTIGGIKKIGSVSEKLVPAMIILYFGGALIILIVKFTAIPAAFALIFKAAFSVKAVGGALIGTSVKQAISIGVRRGVLSNESGLGSAAIAQAASRSPEPTYNGLIAMTGTFIDTIVVNTLTTLSIVLTGAYLQTAAYGSSKGLTSTALTMEAFNRVIPYGGVIIAFSSFLFGYSTLLGWSYYGEKSVEFIFGSKIIYPYRIIFIVLLFIGAIVQGAHLNIIWYTGDSANAIMAFPNLIALLLLSPIIAKETTEKLYKKKYW